MDKYDFDKRIVNLAEILSDLGGIYEAIRLLQSRLGDSIYDLENIKSDLEAFGDEINKENEND